MVLIDTSPSDRLSVNGDASITGDLSVVGSGKSITTQKIVKVGGSSTEFLKADGSVDNSSYMLVGTALTTVQQDTSPNLGGNFNIKWKLITGTGNISISGNVFGQEQIFLVLQHHKMVSLVELELLTISVVGSTLTFNVVGVGSTKFRHFSNILLD